ncbi:MAG: phosphoribosylformylglycinamidine synthase subunit PurS [Actinomycetota bacterium]
MKFSARVNVLLKEGIGDPQGQTIEKALPALGFDGVHDVRVGKLIELTVEASTQEQARARVVDMCEKLLANPVIESYEVTIS